jgi:hypothetical protein
MTSRISSERARHIDVSLIRANLALSPAERLRQQEGLAKDISTLQTAVRKKRAARKRQIPN